MAVIHRATLTPSNLEAIGAWLPSQPWCARGDDPFELIAAYRFDDPAGEVGMETHLVRRGPRLYQVPVTYRGAPLDAGDDALIATTAHSVLGRRWVYAACADPVYVTALTGAIAGEVRQAKLWYDVDGRRERREPSMRITGSGTGTARQLLPRSTVEVVGATSVVHGGSAELVVVHDLGEPVDLGGAATLTGTWDGQEQPVVLACLRVFG